MESLAKRVSRKAAKTQWAAGNTTEKTPGVLVHQFTNTASHRRGREVQGYFRQHLQDGRDLKGRARSCPAFGAPSARPAHALPCHDPTSQN